MYKSQEVSPLNNLQLITTILLIFGGLYLGINALLNKNYLSVGLQHITPNKYLLILKIIYVIIGLAAVYQMFLTPSRTFLTFLDKTVMPPSLLLLSEQADTNLKLKIHADGAIKVMYWAANEDHGKIINNPQDAYDDYENIGISAVKNGVAILKLKCPTAYKVKNKVLPKHLHYRLVYANGVISDIKTVKLTEYCD
jgi:uncharacterized membrane protein YuzA (DUF378 family)